MGLKKIAKFLMRRAFEFTVIALLIVFLPRIPPDAKISQSYKLAPWRPFEGPLALNERLNGVEVWHKGDLLGPEAFLSYKGALYTSVHGGDVVKLEGDHITPVVKFGKACKGVHEENICGRPLGMDLDKNGILYVADAYYGVYKVDLATSKFERLVAVDDEIEGVNVTLPNSVAVASNGDLFWTDSSTEFILSDGVFDLLADGSGRLVHYDSKTKKNKVLISNLHFANGVSLSEDEDFVLVSETVRSRIQRYYLKGPKKGTRDIFIDGLPGMTDNLNRDGKGGFLVPLVVAADKDHPSVSEVLGPFPLLRKFLARSLGLVQFAFKVINDLYPNEIARKGVHFVGHFSMGSLLYPKRVTVLHVSKNGEILDSIHCLNGKLWGISEAHIFGDTLYLGSPFNDYIGRISLEQVGWEHLKVAPTTPKPVTTTPKPVTTTPQPTTTTPKPTTTTPKPTTTTPKPTTTTPKPTTTTPQPTTTTPKPTTTTPKPTTTTPEPVTTTTPKPATTTPKPETTTTTPKPATTTTPTPKPVTTTPTPKPVAAPTATQTPPVTKPTQNEAQTKPVKDQPKAVPVKESPKKN